MADVMLIASQMRQEGRTLPEIADQRNTEGYVTRNGGS
jgi:hypothetical protein